MLTSAAEASLPKLFGLTDAFTLKSWEQGQQLVALGRIGRAKAALTASHDEGLQQDDLAAVLIAAEQGLIDPLVGTKSPHATRTTARSARRASGRSSLVSVVDQMAWRALGVERSEPFTAERVQRYLLRDIIPESARVKLDVFRRMIASKSAGAAKQDAKALTRALLVRPLTSAAGASRSRTWNVRNDNAQLQATSAADAPTTLKDFALAVKAAARGPRVSRYDPARAFIGSVWENMRGREPIGDMSLEEFKAQLVRAHRERLLVITRADLVQAMDPDEVRRSEAQYQNATFHFVALDAGGMR